MAEALVPVATVTLAASDDLLDELSDLPVGKHSIGAPKPSVATGALHGELDSAELAREELGLLRSACEAIAPDHAFHLYSDPVLRWWLQEPPMPAPMTIAVFHPRAHFRRAYGTRLAPKQWLHGRYLEHKVNRWRVRSDAHAALTPDSYAAKLWSARAGAPAGWLPEPPVSGAANPPTDVPRRGCLLFGAIDRRKGFDLFADAVCLAPTDLNVSIAGQVAPMARSELEASIARMRAAGATVEAELDYFDNQADVLRVVRRARCIVLPYRWHPGNSRVLTEAAAVGTPIVGPPWGCVGHFIREYSLGITADPSDPAELRRAILELSNDPDAPAKYAPGLARYTRDAGGERFGEVVRSTFGLEQRLQAPPAGVIPSSP